MTWKLTSTRCKGALSHVLGECKSHSEHAQLINAPNQLCPTPQAVLALYEHPSNQKALPTSTTASMLKTPITGVDASTSWTLNFTGNLRAQAVLSCSMMATTTNFGACIRYEKGNVLVEAPIFRPSSVTIQYFDKPGGAVVREEKKTRAYVGNGWHFEADEVARCVRDGKLESGLWSHDKSILLMETFDEVTVIYNDCGAGGISR